MEENSSSSKFQKGLESKINKALVEYFLKKNIKMNLSDNQYLNLEFKDGIKMKVQPDVCDIENQIFGEIYTCGEKLLAGQQRKVGTDMLKLLTIEKLVKDSQNKDIQKLIILTSYDSNQRENNLTIDLNLEISKKLLGPASWKIKAIELFGFEVLIYFLSVKDKNELDETRKKQGQKFKNK